MFSHLLRWICVYLLFLATGLLVLAGFTGWVTPAIIAFCILIGNNVRYALIVDSPEQMPRI